MNVEVELEALSAALEDAERGLLHYEAALTRIESFSVDNNDRVALRMGEIAREALAGRGDEPTH